PGRGPSGPQGAPQADTGGCRRGIAGRTTRETGRETLGGGPRGRGRGPGRRGPGQRARAGGRAVSIYGLQTARDGPGFIWPITRTTETPLQDDSTQGDTGETIGQTLRGDPAADTIGSQA